MRALRFLVVAAALVTSAPLAAQTVSIDPKIETAIMKAQVVNCEGGTLVTHEGQDWCIVRLRFKDRPEIAISVALPKTQGDPKLGWLWLAPKFGSTTR